MRKSTKHVACAFLLAFASGGSMHAQYQLLNSGDGIAGEYTGKLSVVINDGQVPPTDETVMIETNVDNTFATFSLHNFALEDGSEVMGVGNIDITEIPIVTDGDTVRLSIDKKIWITDGDDPNVLWLGPSVSGTDGIPISLTAKVSNDGKVYVTIDIPLIPGVMDVEVSFTNDTPESVTEIGRSENAFFLYRVSDNTIGVAGVENGTSYEIFHQSGILVKNGTLQGGDLNIENLVSGMYFMRVGTKVEKFIR